ncbi:MAG: transcriptional repressor NrdR [Ruminiclostridium sp.]|nr:transcriptional repressor NrdR [Ruminiclostridium sp.]
MKCPECGFDDSKVIDSRPAENKIRRRRECLECKCRFTTYEIVENIPLMVVKKGNVLEPFDREKLIKSLTIATAKRPVKMAVLEDMVEDVVQDLKNQFRREVTSYEIGEMVLQRLKTIDKVAYIRFASVYKDFNDIDSFVKIISELNNEKQ